ncbi:P-type ATPase [Penicillium verhagenii]|nr:P-type ATPase [Penicillium verhagenii]
MHSELPLVGRSLAMFTLSCVMLGLSVITVSFRCFVRGYLVRAFGWDDTLMVAALIIYTSLIVCCIVGAKDGVGHQLVDFGTNIKLYESALRWWWLSQILYIWSSAVTKISIAVALLRLTIRKTHRIILYSLIGISVANALLFFFVLVLDCHPISYFWRQADPTAKGSCVSSAILLNIAYLYSAFTILCDFTLGILPIVLVWNLQMSGRTKFAVGGNSELGCHVCGILDIGEEEMRTQVLTILSASVAVVIRLPFLHFYLDPDFLYSTYQIAIWSIIETGLGIIAGSLVTLRPLFRWFFDASLYGKNKRYGKSGSVRYPLATLKADGTGPKLSNDPKFWRPDIDDTKGMVTSVSSPRERGYDQNNSSEEHLYPGDGSVRNPYHVSIHETITVTEVTHASFS